MSAKITRRQALTIGAVGAGVVAVGAAATMISRAVLDEPSIGEVDGAPVPESPSAEGLPGWSEPEVLTSRDGVLELDLRVAAAEVVVGGATVQMLAYNGTVPGPTLHLRAGDTLRVHLRNELGVPTNLHTHGLHVSGEGNSDNPLLDIAPGESFDYEIVLPDDHPAGVNWYHPHRHGMVADQIFAGLYGAIIVDDEDWEAAAPRVVVVSDTTIIDGRVAEVSRPQRMAGRTGEMLLTNGQPAPALRGAAGSEQRLLLINACASRYLDLGFAGLAAQLRGVDSLRLAAPEAVERRVLAPGNRVDVIVRVPDAETPVVAAPYDRGQAGMGMGGQSTAAPEAVVLRLVPDSASAAPGVADAAGSTWQDLREREPDGARTLTLSMGMGGGMGGGMRFLIDGREFAHHRIDQEVRLGTMEEWTIVNDSMMAHPFHLHIWPMQVVRVAEQAVSGIDVRDVIDVPPFSSVTVRLAFERFPGRTVYHCHILDHEDLGMMGVLRAS